MQKDLFIIESPFQLLSAIEAVDFFRSENPYLIVKYTNERKNNEQIDKLLLLVNWKKVTKFRTYKFVSLNEIFIIPHIARLRLTGIKYRHIFIGQPRSGLMQLFPANLRHKECFLMDDGNLTIFIQNELAAGKDLRSMILRNKKFDASRRIYCRLLMISERMEGMPNWFTCFDISPLPDQVVFNHSFKFTKKLLSGWTEDETKQVYFIGGNLSEAGVLSEEKELNYLRRIFAFYQKQGISMIYCVHRRESQAKLDRIRNISTNILFKKPEYPLELDLIYSRANVSHVAAFYSTALATINKIFEPDDIRMFWIQPEDISNSYRDEILLTYKNYASVINITKLTD